MAYIGSTPTSQNFISGTDYFNGTGSQTAFTLTRSVNSVNDVEVVVNNVIQQPSGYTVSGTTLTLSAAPSSGTSNVYVRYLATNQQSFTVGNNTVGYNQLTADMQSKFAMKNRIINGDMRIDQRNAGASVTLSTDNRFPVDRFAGYADTDGVMTAQRDTSAPAGFTNSIKFTTTTADASLASSQVATAFQNIEGNNIADLGWGTANAKTVTLSFWVRSSLTGTFGGALVNTNGTRSYPFSYTISSANTWEQKSIVIVGDTTGTWLTDNGVGIRVRFGLGAGSTWNGTAGAWVGSNLFSVTGATSVIGTLNATFYLTGVQLEVGTSSTPFDTRAYGTELALCQRYYHMQAKGSGDIGVAWYFTNTQCSLAFSLPVTMRATPSLSFASGAYYTLYRNGGSQGLTTFLVDNPSLNFVTLYNSTEASGTAGQAGLVRITNAAGFVAVSAEL